MSSNGYYTRLAAAVATAAVMGAVIVNPDAGRKTAERAASARADRLNAHERACAPGEAPLTGDFAPPADVLSVTPLGAAAAPREVPPTPYIRLFAGPREATRAAPLSALAPAKGEIVGLERRIVRGGGSETALWSVRFKPCDRIVVIYDRLERIDDAILRRAGGLQSFTEIGGPDRRGVAVRLKVGEGDFLGSARAFDVGLFDLAAPPALHADASHARDRTAFADADGVAPELARALAVDDARARCAIDYLDPDIKPVWAGKLADAAGARRAKGDNSCVAAFPSAQAGIEGAWFTDSSHNARTSKVSAVALFADLIDSDRLVFSLHGRLASLTQNFLDPRDLDEKARRTALRGVVTAQARDGPINTRLDEVETNKTICYEGLRSGFDGPLIAGVFLIRVEVSIDAAALMKIEARPEASACGDLPEPWSFAGDETSFYR